MADTSLVLNILAKDKTKAGWSSVSNKAKLAFAAMGAAVGAYAAGAVKAAAGDQQAAAVLARTLRNTTGARKADIASVEDWISSTTLATGVADDELRPALGNLLRATKDTAKSQDLLKTAMNISAATGRPLEQVSLSLSKAYGGNVAALGRLGVNVKNAKGKTVDFATAQKRLNDQFGGAQAAKQKTFAGQVQILKNRWDETQETVGYYLIPILMKLMTFVTGTAIPALASFGGWVQKNKSWLIPLAAVIGSLVGTIYLVSKAIKAWTAVQAILNVVMSANPIALVVIGIAALVAGIVIAYKKSETFRKIVQAMGRGVVAAWRWVVAAAMKAWGVMKSVGHGISVAFGWVVAKAKVMWGVLKTVFGWTPYGLIIKHFGAIVDFFKKLPDRIGRVFSGLADIISKPFTSAFGFIKSLWNSTVGGFGFTAPKWIPIVGGNSFHIPMMAAGGIVTRPTLAILGEAGPEAVVPLSGGARAAAGGGLVVHGDLVVQANNAEEMVRSLRKYMRSHGGNVQVVLGGAR